MARVTKLKVFRTSIGFHDAYVAAPSQKAALEAWGTSSNLFARGEAEIVTDAALSKEPLSSPGRVIKRLRGTTEQHLAALPRTKRTTADRTQQGAAATPSAKPRRRPSRAELDRLEASLTSLDDKQHKEVAEIERLMNALRKQASGLERGHDQARAALARKVEGARDRYEQALRDWD